MGTRLGSLAATFGCELIGDPDTDISWVATLSNAGPGAISFLANSAYRGQLAETDASAVVLRPADADDCRTNALLADEPYAVFARIAAQLYPQPALVPGVHPSAVVHETARVHDGAQIDALAYVGPDCVIGDGAHVGPGSVIGRACTLGPETTLSANVSLIEDVIMGARCLVHAGTVIGADGFGHAPSRSGYVKVPQVGGVRIGDDVEIGSNTSIDRGAIDDTVIENGVRLDNQIQIGHNCRVGEHSVLAAQVGLSGTVSIGKRCMVAGKVGFVGHISVCDDVVITGAAVVTKSITEPGVYSGSFAAEKDKDWKRRVARFRRLESLGQRLTSVEQSIREPGDE